jgi:hypothetical protein
VSPELVGLDPADAEPTLVHISRREPRWYERRRVAGVLLGLAVLAAVLMSLTTWLDPGTAPVPLVEGERVEHAVTDLEKQGLRTEIIQEGTEPCPLAS